MTTSLLSDIRLALRSLAAASSAIQPGDLLIEIGALGQLRADDDARVQHDALTERAAATLDDGARERLLREAVAMVDRETAMIPLRGIIER